MSVPAASIADQGYPDVSALVTIAPTSPPMGDTVLSLVSVLGTFDSATATLTQGANTASGLTCFCAVNSGGTTNVVVDVPATVMKAFAPGPVAGVLSPSMLGVPLAPIGFAGEFAPPNSTLQTIPFAAFAYGPAPRLVAAYQDSQGRVTLAFAWPLAIPGNATTTIAYTATLWADAGRSVMLGATQPVVTGTPNASFSGIPAGAAFLLDVVAIGSDGTNSQPLSLIATTNAVGLNPGLPVGNADVPGQDTVGGVTFGERPFYGSVEGVKHWARIVTYGNNRQEVSDLDLLYFLMGASDVIDSHLMGMYYVPLVKYRAPGYDAFRYPPGISFQCDRLAAAMLIQARKSNLTEDVSGYANTLEQGAMAELLRLSASMSLPGQSLGQSFAFDVVNPNPRQFAMPGDAAGWNWSAATGYPDMRSFRQAELPYSRVSWRFGSGFSGANG